MNITDVALRYLAHRPRTENEMFRHLSEKGFQDEEIREALQELTTKKYIDDIEYGNMYLRYGFEKGSGIKRLQRELQDKGLSAEDIKKAIFAYENEAQCDIYLEEEERALRQAKKIMSSCEVPGEKDVAKLGRKLERLGYPTSLIYKIVDKYRIMIKEG